MNPFIMDRDLLDLETLMMLRGIKGKAVEAEATGNPLTFVTDLAKPLKSLLIPFTPQQEGTGDPSPQNIRSILPWNGLKVFGGGKNLLSDSAVSYGSWETDGSEIQNDNNKYRRLSVNLPAGNYVFSTDTTNCYIIRLLIDDTVIGTGGAIQSKNFTLTASANVKIAWRNTDTSEITGTLHNQIELGSSASAYEAPHITETDIVFPSPIYGGTPDIISGRMLVEWGVRIETGQSPGSWSSTETATLKRWVLNRGAFEKLPKESGHLFANYFKNSTSSTAWNAFLGSTSNFLCYIPLEDFPSKDSWLDYLAQNPLIIVYELDEPYEVQLTPTQITALIGNNTIWSDADGSMTATYLKKG